MVRMPAYLAWMGGSAVLTALWYAFLASPRGARRRGAALALLTLALGLPLGLIGSRLGYLLLRVDVFPWNRPMQALGRLEMDELSIVGGAAGVCLAVALAARCLKAPGREALNRFAPAGALMLALARFGEQYLGMLGVGMYLEEPLFPVTAAFTWDGEWFEYYLAVYILEGAAALAVCVFSLLRRKEEDCFLRTVFYLCLPQILLESLRMQSISWLFVRAEQLVCYLVCEGILIGYAVRAGGKQPRAWGPPAAGLLACGVVILGEFALDGKIGLPDGDIPIWLIYTVMALALAAMAAAEHAGRKRLYGTRS